MVSGLIISEVSGIGRMNRLVFSGVRFCISCRCWLNISFMLISVMVVIRVIVMLWVKCWLWNSVKLIIGLWVWCWWWMNRYR